MRFLRHTHILLLLSMAAATVTPAAAAPRSVGLIIDASPAANRVPFMRFADTLMDALAASREWEPTALHEASPLVRISGAAWPQPTRNNWMTAAEGLQALLLDVDLDDLLVVAPIPAPTNDLEIFWLRQGDAEIRRLHVSEPGAGDQAYQALVRKLLAALKDGPEQAPVAAKAGNGQGATTTATTAGPAAIEVAARPTPPAPGPSPTASAPASPPDLTPPAAQAAQPGAAPLRPDAPATQPAAEPVGPATAPAPAAPEGAETTPVTPGTTTPPAAPDTPVTPAQPLVFLPAAQKYLRGGEYKRVEEMLIKAEEAGEPRAEVYALWAELEKVRRNSAAERLWLERAATANQTLTAVHLRLAELLRQEGLWRKALAEYQIALAQDPNNLHVYLGLAALYEGQSQPRRAAEWITEATKRHPRDASLYLRLGDLHAGRQGWAEAENAYDRAARLTEGVARAEALDRLGDLYVRAERDREGFVCYAEASRLREGRSTPMAEKRYQQIMESADESLLQAATRARATLDRFRAGQDTYREDVWLAFDELRKQTGEVSEFVNMVLPPATMEKAHLERKLAYSLAAEAALAAMDYVDQGEAQRLEDYGGLIAEAEASLRRLQQPAVTM